MAQTEIKCQGVSARMMELLYGELSGDDQAAFEAHLAGCASCRAELSSFQSTRAPTRRVLDADEPPARAHQAILRAAAAAVAVAAKKPNAIAARAAAPRPSFWARWRGRWTLPTFATVGALAVVVLASKIFLEPARTVDLGRHALRSAPAEAPAAPPAAAEPAAPATAPRRRATPDGFGELGGLSKGSGAASAGRAKAEVADETSVEDESAVAAPGVAKPAKRQFAPPPPPRVQPARAATPAARQAELEALDEGAPSTRGSVGHLAAGAGAAPPPSRAKAKKMDMPSEMPSEADDLDRGPAAASAPAPARAPAAAPAAAMADKSDARAEGSAESNPVAESPVAHADRLFALRQWAAAARAYRELLRRDPNNGDAARWRQRLAASEEAASAQAPAAAPAAAPARR